MINYKAPGHPVEPSSPEAPPSAWDEWAERAAWKFAGTTLGAQRQNALHCLLIDAMRFAVGGSPSSPSKPLTPELIQEIFDCVSNDDPDVHQRFARAIESAVHSTYSRLTPWSLGYNQGWEQGIASMEQVKRIVREARAEDAYTITAAHANRLSGVLAELHADRLISENDWSVLQTLAKQAVKAWHD